MNWMPVSLLVSLTACLVQYGFCEPLIVELNHGKVSGLETVDENGNVYYAFKGIPYAEPPINHLRFKPPVPKLPWDGILDTVENGPPCPQISIFLHRYEGAEDNCLTLNVYTPKLPSSNKDSKLDVMFHIHGGGFALGSGGDNFIYNPKRFMPKEKNIVLVSITYRVSSLGFLSTADEASPGNYGLLDQVEALRWVRNNIDRFGGDPAKVTIIGESAGGASVMYHYISPLSKGLFQRAIAMSGTVFDPWAYQHEATHWTNDLANRVGCPVDDTRKQVECLKLTPAEELITNEETFVNKVIHFVFTPTLDHYFLPDTPFNIIKNKQYNDVPLLIGVTKDEGNCWNAFHPGPQPANDGEFTDEEIDKNLQMLFSGVKNLDKAIPKLKAKYFSSSKKKEDVDKFYAKIVTDGFFHMYNYMTIKMLAEKGSKVYAYSYNYEGSSEMFKMLFRIPDDVNIGVCHGFELANFFSSMLTGPEPLKDKNLDMKNQMQKLFFNFALHGTPNSEDVEVKWPQVEENKLHVYNINTKSSVSVFDETKDGIYEFWIKTLPRTLGPDHQLSNENFIKEEL